MSERVSHALLTTGMTHVKFFLSRVRSCGRQERKQIAELSGANAPHLEQLVKHHCPPLGADDDES